MPWFLISLMPSSLLFWTGIILGNPIVLCAGLALSWICFILWLDYDRKTHPHV